MAGKTDQEHPQYRSDRGLVNQLLASEPTDYNLAELGRLIIRYQGFPGAYDIQRDLEKVLKNWQLSEAELYQKTQAIHAQGSIYQDLGCNREDWS